MSSKLNEFFSRTFAFFHETHSSKQRFPIVIALAVIILLAGCGDNVSATNQPKPKPTPTPTELPIYYEVTPTPVRLFSNEILQLGGRLELTTTEGQPPDGKGVVIIEIVNWVERGSIWQIKVESNMTHGANLGCSFGDVFNCRGELDANGEKWPKEGNPTGLGYVGISLVGQTDGVVVTYDDRWNKENN